MAIVLADLWQPVEVGDGKATPPERGDLVLVDQAVEFVEGQARNAAQAAQTCSVS